MSDLDLFGGRTTADNGVRSAGDFYESPSWMTRSLLTFHQAIKGAKVLECCSGRDAIARVLRDEAGCTVATNDIDQRHPAQTHDDATTGQYWETFRQRHGAPEWVVTNMPYNIAIKILPLAVWFSTFGVATILPKSFDEPTEERGEWLNAHPWTRKICLPRHSFRGTGSPSMASDWFIWEKTPDRSLPACVVDHIAKTRTR